MNNEGPKMTRAQAKLFWKHMTPQQRIDFNQMMKDLEAGKLQYGHITVDDNEQIQRVVLEPKDPRSKSMEPFLSKFHLPPNAK